MTKKQIQADTSNYNALFIEWVSISRWNYRFNQITAVFEFRHEFRNIYIGKATKKFHRLITNLTVGSNEFQPEPIAKVWNQCFDILTQLIYLG